MTVNEKHMDDLVKTLFDRGDPYEVLEKEQGPAVREYRRKWKMAGEHLSEFQYPLHLNFELVYGCNLRCEFCIFNLPAEEWDYKARPGDKISFEKYQEVVDEGVRHGLCSIALNGYNEPLLQADIVKYIDYARKAGVLDVSLHTNGLLLTEKMSRALIDSGLTMIMFSIDAATGKTYEKIRQSRDFNKAIKNVTDFVALKKTAGKALPLTRVSFVETKVNHMELEDFVSYWRNKIDFFTVQTFFNPFVGKDNYEKIESEYRLKDTSFSVCAEPYQRLMITCDGNVLPCCSNYGLGLVVGNIYQDSVYNIWNSKKMKELRSKINGSKEVQPEACRKCRASVMSPKSGMKEETS